MSGLDTRVARFETQEVLQDDEEGCLLAAQGPDGEPALLLVPRAPEMVAREIERLTELRGPGIPGGRAVGADGAEAVQLVGADGARPLRPADALPDTVWRPALRRLLSALSHCHGHGWVHGRLARRHLLADGSGVFWISGWAGARPAVGRGPFQSGTDDVAADLRDLGHACVRYLAAVPDDADVDAAAAERASSRLAAIDREVARVVVRLVAADPREAYETATEVLADLGEPDESLPDPWSGVPFVARKRLVRNVLAHAERAGTRMAVLGSYEIYGEPGSGRSRVLAEIAAAARRRSMDVMSASGGAPNQPWGAVGSLARQMLSRLPADHPLRSDPGVHALAGDRATASGRPDEAVRGESAAATLAKLLEESFRTRRGVVLLDDEDALSSHALQAWRSLGRHAAAAAGSSASPCALLVSTAVRPSEPEAATPRERAELTDLSRRHVVRLLGDLMVERGEAALLGEALVASAGGRPAEVVDHIREMVERGAARATGVRLQIEDPVAAVACCGGADRFRRAVDAAGRDAAALAEVLSVTGRLRFPREALSDLADLPGPRLAAAADAALRAGLIRRDGASWILRTESLRARLVRGMADDRRRGLHREVLQRLLDADPPDWPQIAHHGRASSDPRAAEWTRTAFRVLLDAGRYAEAASHLDDARVLLGPAALDPALRLEHVDVLLNAGRLSDAVRAAEEAAADPTASPRQRGLAALALARLHRYDQAWSRVLSAELPIACGDPLVLAKIRCLRAIAHLFHGRTDLADREERLAAAEVADATDPATADELRYARLEVETIRRGLAWDLQGSRRAALSRMRSRMGRAHPLDRLLDSVYVGNSHRVSGDLRRARRTLHRTRLAAHRTLQGNPLILSWIDATLALIDLESENLTRYVRRSESAALHARRAGGRSLALNRRLALARARAKARTLPWADVQLARDILRTGSHFDDDTLPSSGRAVAVLFLFCAMHRPLTELRDAVCQRRLRPYICAEIRALHATSALLLDQPPPVLLQLRGQYANSTSEAINALQSDAHDGFDTTPATTDANYPTPPVSAFLAHLIRLTHLQDVMWPTDWPEDRLFSYLADIRPSEWIWLDVVYSWALCRWDRTSPERRHTLRALIIAHAQALPTAMEWRRTLAVSRLHWADLRVSKSIAAARRAASQCEVLRRDATGPGCDETLRVAQAILTAQPMITLGHSAPRSSAHPLARSSTSHSTFDSPFWDAARAALLRAGRAFATIPIRGDVLHLAADLRQALRADTGLRSPERHITLPHALVLALPEEATPAELRTLISAASSVGTAGQLILLSTLHAAALREASPHLRTLVDITDGLRIALPPLLSAPPARHSLFNLLLSRRFGPVASIASDARELIQAYTWPGGVAEAEAVVATLSLGSTPVVTADSLLALGWDLRLSQEREATDQATVAALLAALRQTPGCRSTEYARATERPLRTVQRALQALVLQRRATRAGAGRATTYSPVTPPLDPVATQV